MSTNPTDELSIILVEDNPGNATLFEHHLTTSRSGSFPPATVHHVESLDAAIESLKITSYDLVLLDLGLPESSGFDTLERYNEAIEYDWIEPTPVVVLTELKDDIASVEAIERGCPRLPHKGGRAEVFTGLSRAISICVRSHNSVISP